MVVSVWKNGMFLSFVLASAMCSPVLAVEGAPVCNADDCPFAIEPDTSMQRYLSPRLLEDPETLRDVGRRLKEGELVVIADAFLPEFAEAMHQELDKADGWELYEDYLEDGFHYSHHNIYDKSKMTKLMNDTFDMFDHPDTKRFIEELVGRDCSGVMTASPSYYHPGDHSLPHTDFLGGRSVAYVWHLSKNWKPEWGGALYWNPEHIENAQQDASFNTLVLFSVTPHSTHFVTTVAPHAKEKRLTFNGWWESNYEPTVEDPLEEIYATPEQRLTLTFEQADWILNEIDTSDLDPKRQEALEKLQDDILEESTPGPVSIHIL